MKTSESIQNLRDRTKRYALRIIRMSTEIPEECRGKRYQLSNFEKRHFTGRTLPGSHTLSFYRRVYQ